MISVSLSMNAQDSTLVVIKTLKKRVYIIPYRILGEINDKYYNFDTLYIKLNDKIYKKETDNIFNNYSSDNSIF